MKLFSERNIDLVIKDKLKELKGGIKNTDAQFLREPNFAARALELYRFPIPEFHFDRLTVSVNEILMPDAKQEGSEIVVLEIEYRLPLSGNINILEHGSGTKEDLEVDLVTSGDSQYFSLKFISQTREPQAIVLQQEAAVEIIRRNSELVIVAANKWNEDLADLIRMEIAVRERTIKQMTSFISALGVPQYI